MGILNFFKSGKSKKRPPLTNEIGTFSFTDCHGEKSYKGKVDAKINAGIELIFPVNTDEISIYQTKYFVK